MSDTPSTPYEPISRETADGGTASGGGNPPATPTSGTGVWSPRPAGWRDRRQAPPKLYRIGEVVEYSGVSRQTVHNYTTMGLLQERRWTPGGHRLYDESVFERLDIISEMKSHRKTLQDIREYFQNAAGAAGAKGFRHGPPAESAGPEPQKST